MAKKHDPTRQLVIPIGEVLQVIHLHLEPRDLPPAVSSGADVVSLIVPHVQGLHREAFFAVPLNNKHQPLGILVSMGTTTQHRSIRVTCSCRRSWPAPRPSSWHTTISGDPTPSHDDRRVTGGCAMPASCSGSTCSTTSSSVAAPTSASLPNRRFRSRQDGSHPRSPNAIHV